MVFLAVWHRHGGSRWPPSRRVCSNRSPQPVRDLDPPGLVLAGILKFVGGHRDSVTLGGRSVPWNVLDSIGDIVLGSVVIPAAIPEIVSGNADSRFNALGMLAGGVFMVWYGVQVARDSHRVDLEDLQEMPSGPVVALVAVLVGWMGIGLLTATVRDTLP